VENVKAIALTELPPGILARVENIVNPPDNITLERFLQHRFLQHLAAMGILRDRPIEVLRQASFGGPLHIRVGETTELAIRRQEAQYITVISEQ
jgi:Fe2+ transport system protein FeoA